MKKVLLCFVLCILIFGLCGCGKEKNVVENNTKKEQIEVPENIEKTESEINNKDKQDEVKKENKKEETTTKQETTTKKEENTTNNSNIEKEDKNENSEISKDEPDTSSKEEINKKIVVCTIQQEGSYYYGTTTHTTTFENDIIVHNKMYSEKHFKDGYKAEEDSWTISNIKALQNNTKVGISGNAYIENNITYLIINYDVKANADLMSLITAHTEYNDFFNNMTTKNGYSCITK